MQKMVVDAAKAKKYQEFIRRMFFMRQLGTILCLISYLSVMVHLYTATWIYVLMLVNTFAWPILAYLYNSRHQNPVRAEYRALSIEGFFAGVWIALMGINPFPTIITITIVLSDRFSVGGVRLISKVILLMFIGFISTWLLAGRPIFWNFKPEIIISSLPLATIYILALSFMLRQMLEKLKIKTDQLEKIALNDPRLQIANRHYFETKVNGLFKHPDSQKKAHAYLLLIDIDNFKQVNDQFGHETGDELLLALAEVIRSTVSPADLPARFGGDELAILVFRERLAEVHELAEQILNKTRRIRLQGQQQTVFSVSIGIACAENLNDATEWLRKADQALYQVKRSGRNNISMGA